VSTPTVMDPNGLAAEAAAGKLKVYRQSTVGSLEICLRRGRYAADPNRSYSTGEARAAGTSYHAGLETFFDWCQSWHEGAIKPPDDSLFRDMVMSSRQALFREIGHHEKDNGAGTFPWDTSLEATEARVLAMLEAWRAKEAWPDPATYKVIGVEQEWWAPFVPGWAIKGTIDLVLLNILTGATEFEDHKTAKKRWPQTKGSARQSPQPGIYSWAWWALTGEMVNRFHYGVMTYGGVFERRSWDITAEHVQRTIDKAVAYLPFLDMPIEALPGNTTSNLCSEKYCDNWKDCPFGAAF
jgi:hypothetical protein